MCKCCFRASLITDGVPKSSALGPTLFNIHINGITDTCTESEVVLYADDTEIHAMLIGSEHAVKNTRPLEIVLDGKPMKQD